MGRFHGVHLTLAAHTAAAAVPVFLRCVFVRQGAGGAANNFAKILKIQTIGPHRLRFFSFVLILFEETTIGNSYRTSDYQ